MTSDKGLVERLRPSAVVDETVGKAVRALRAEGFVMLAGSLNEWLVENNSLKSEAQARIETLERALRRVRSYNVDIEAGRINYRPLDHIAVIDAALSPSTNSPEK